MLRVATAIQEVCYCPLLAFIRSFSRLSQDASYLRTCVKGCSKMRRVLAKSRLILDEMAVYTESLRLISGVLFSPELNTKRLYRCSGKEQESRCLGFTSSTKQEIRHFHSVVVH